MHVRWMSAAVIGVVVLIATGTWPHAQSRPTQKALITKMQGWSIGATPQIIKALPSSLQKTELR